MSRSFLAAMRSAIFSPPEIAASIEEQPVSIAATPPPPVAHAQPVPSASIATATHPSSVQDMQGRFAVVAKAPGISGCSKRLTTALQLAAEAPDMSTRDIIEWTMSYVPAADAPASSRKIPTLFEREADAQRQVGAIGPSADNTSNGWGMAIDEAMRLHKIN